MTRPGWLAEAARGWLVVCLAVLGILATALVVNGDSPVGVLWTRHDSHLYYGVTLAIELAVALFASAVFAVVYWGKGDSRRAVVVLPGTVAHVFLPEPQLLGMGLAGLAKVWVTRLHAGSGA